VLHKSQAKKNPGFTGRDWGLVPEFKRSIRIPREAGMLHVLDECLPGRLGKFLPRAIVLDDALPYVQNKVAVLDEYHAIRQNKYLIHSHLQKVEKKRVGWHSMYHPSRLFVLEEFDLSGRRPGIAVR
jgi:hypothetical protein